MAKIRVLYLIKLSTVSLIARSEVTRITANNDNKIRNAKQKHIPLVHPVAKVF